MWKKILPKILIFIATIALMAGGVYGLMYLLGVNTIEGLQAICNDNAIISYTMIIALQIIQVVFIPISNQIITVPAIAVIGIWPAFFCSWIGIEIGTIILYFIGRFGGGKFLKWLLGDKEKADKFKDLIISRKLFYPVGMLIGVIPDDLLTTLAGVAKMNFWYIFIVSIITRGVCVLTTVFGFGILTQSTVGIILLVIGLIAICALGYIFLRYEPKIEIWFKNKFSRKKQ